MSQGRRISPIPGTHHSRNVNLQTSSPPTAAGVADRTATASSADLRNDAKYSIRISSIRTAATTAETRFAVSSFVITLLWCELTVCLETPMVSLVTQAILYSVSLMLAPTLADATASIS